MIKNIKTRIRLVLSRVFGKDFFHIPRDLIRSCPVVSFDVFDTLIIRDYPIPTDLFDRISDDRSFKARRIEAEKAARSLSLNRGLEEITLLDIYKYLCADEGERQEAMEGEINEELKACKPNQPALSFFNKCKEEGKHVIIISDMYLNAHTIKSILIDKFNKITDTVFIIFARHFRNRQQIKSVLSLLEIE